MSIKHFFHATSIALAILTVSQTSSAGGIPTVDLPSLQQNAKILNTEIEQKLTQIQQLKTTIQSYEQQMKDALAPTVYAWDQTQDLINQAQSTYHDIQNLKNQLTDTNGLLDKYTDIGFYRSSPCYSGSGCSSEELDRASKSLQEMSDQADKYVNTTRDNVHQSAENEEQAIKEETKNLRRKQQLAQDAAGQMQAMQATNEFLSQLNSQVIQMREINNKQLEAAQALQTRQEAERTKNKAMWESFTTTTEETPESQLKSTNLSFKPR